MKKIISVVLMIVLLVGVYSNCVYAEENNKITMVDQIQEVIYEVNEAYDATLYIPYGSEQEVLNNIMNNNETTDSLKGNLIAAWRTYKQLAGEVNLSMPQINTTIENGNSMQPYSYTERVSLMCPIEYNSWLSLVADIKTVNGVYKFQSVISYGIGYQQSAEIRVEPMGGSYYFSADKTKCTLTMNGVPKTREGIALNVMKTYTYTFSAFG